jgi:hypothetical protein
MWSPERLPIRVSMSVTSAGAAGAEFSAAERMPSFLVRQPPGSLAMLGAMRRALSRVSSLAAARLPSSSSGRNMRVASFVCLRSSAGEVLSCLRSIEVSEDDLRTLAEPGYEGAASTDHDQQAQAVGLFLNDALLQI